MTVHIKADDRVGSEVSVRSCKIKTSFHTEVLVCYLKKNLVETSNNLSVKNQVEGEQS